MYLSKDFILTPEGLVFAVVAEGLEDGKVLAFLRYQQAVTGFSKLSTSAANTLLTNQFPDYLFYSKLRDTVCHAVPLQRIAHHFQPRERLQQILATPATDPVLQDCVALLVLLQNYEVSLAQVGITGSLLIAAQHPDSDLDLVIYDRAVFQQIRQVVRTLISHNQLQDLSPDDWLAAYQRRGCELSFEQYCWHERRKGNKAMLNGRKIDFSLQMPQTKQDPTIFRKTEAVIRQFKVLDAALAYDHPAQFIVADAEVTQVICYTATYTGQAEAGECIEVAGQLEIAADGQQRIIVGASREATGEYIKVIQHA